MKRDNFSGDAYAKMRELLKGINLCMLTTKIEDGSLKSRPMAIQQFDADNNIWMLTDSFAPKVDEVNNYHQVGLSFMDEKNQKYVSVSGRAVEIRDPHKVHELWNPMLKAWFPNGPDDSNIGILKVTPSFAEYWDAPSGTLVQMIGLAKAVVKGEPYDYEGADHGKVKL